MFKEESKAIDAAEKDLNIKKYFRIYIGYNDNETRVFHQLHQYDLPCEIWQRKYWVIRWRIAWLQCQYPKQHIISYTSTYDNTSGLDLSYNSILSKVTSAKGWLTRARKTLDKYINIRNQELFQDFDNDPLYQKAVAKVKAKEEKLEELMKQLEEEKQKRKNDNSNIK